MFLQGNPLSRALSPQLSTRQQKCNLLIVLEYMPDHGNNLAGCFALSYKHNSQGARSQGIMLAKAASQQPI
jgi:hypothetical protein